MGPEFREDIRCILDLRHAKALDRAILAATKINSGFRPAEPISIMVWSNKLSFGQFDARRRAPRRMLDQDEYFGNLEADDSDLARSFKTGFGHEVSNLLLKLAESDPLNSMVAVFHFNSFAMLFEPPARPEPAPPPKRPWRIGIVAFDGARTIAEEDQCIAGTARSRGAGRQLDLLCSNALAGVHDDEDDESELVAKSDQGGSTAAKGKSLKSSAIKGRIDLDFNF